MEEQVNSLEGFNQASDALEPQTSSERPGEERANKLMALGWLMSAQTVQPEYMPLSPAADTIAATGVKIRKARTGNPQYGRTAKVRKPTAANGPKSRREEPYDDLIRLYLDDISKYPLLTKDDEVRLAQTREAGLEAKARLESDENLKPSEMQQLSQQMKAGIEANRQFVNCNLRLVVSIAKKYTGTGLPLLDIIQEGNLGLMHAVEKFDWRKGFKFSTYATWWIKQAIGRGTADTKRIIRMPIHTSERLDTLYKTQTRLEAKLGRTPSRAELAQALNITLAQLTKMLLYAQATTSLSLPIDDTGDTELGDMYQDHTMPDPFEQASKALIPAEIEKILAQLNNRERTIIVLRFGLDGGGERTLEETAAHFGLTRERIRQIESKAMTKLKHLSHVHDEARLLLG